MVLGHYSLTTGGRSDLRSIKVIYNDPGEPILLEGFRNGEYVWSECIGNYRDDPVRFHFSRFMGQDALHVTTVGIWNDMDMDDLMWSRLPFRCPRRCHCWAAGF